MARSAVQQAVRFAAAVVLLAKASPKRVPVWPTLLADIFEANNSGLALLPPPVADREWVSKQARVSEPVHPTSANIPAPPPLVYAIDSDNMTQKKRHLETSCEDQPLKRVRRVFAQFPLNLFRIGPSITFRDNTAASSTTTMARQESCTSCSSQIDSRNAICTFCEQACCSECELVCFKCDQVYCGLCAMRTYAPIYNSGKCFSCD